MHRHSSQLSLSSSQLRTYACVVFSFTFDCSFMLSSCLRSRLLCLRVFASLFSLLCVQCFSFCIYGGIHADVIETFYI